MENKKTIQSVHANGSDGEKILAKIDNQSLLEEAVEVDTPKGIVNFLQKRIFQLH